LAKYLLDTDIIINYLRNQKETVSLVQRFFKEGAILGCCSVNITEVYAGMREKEKPKVDGLIDSLEFFPTTRETSRLAGEYIRKFSKKGITLSLSDATIAAVAVTYGLTLATGNVRHYPIPGIKIYCSVK